MSLYGWLILGTFLGPFALSFDKKVHFYTFWRALFPAITLVAIVFLIWDEYFTQNGIWGFNPDYLSGIFLGNLPLEEVSFFFVVPFACVFIYEVLKAYFPNVTMRKAGQIFAFTIVFSGLLFGSMNLQNWYTASACIIAAILTIGIYFIQRVHWFGSFTFAYLVAIIPFLLVNGALTGAVTPEPVVWYSENHIMGPRIITIPVEDLFYNYDMLIGVIWIYERLKRVPMFASSR
jgi:lycopene cyclase domain-containing protein